GFLPDWSRNPVSITLTQTANSGALSIGTASNPGSGILVDPGASITLDAANQITVLGILDAPAGNINLNLSLPSSLGYLGTQSIWLGSHSQVLARGYFLQSAPNANGLIQGQVLSGGHINIAANGGFFVADKGSVMDVSGTSANIDLPSLNSGKLTYGNTHIAGDAGSISVAAVDGAVFDGTMDGSAEAGSHAAAGSFSFFLNGRAFKDTYDVSVQPGAGLAASTNWNISVNSSGSGDFISNAGLTPGNDSGAGSTSLQPIEGQAYLDQTSLKSFDQVSLKSYNSISLADNVGLSARRGITLDSPLIDAGANDSLNSAHVTLGNLDNGNQVSVAPAAGTGSLNVSAELVDLSGKFSISRAKTVDIASSGDIRFNGEFDNTTSLSNPNGQSLKGNLITQGDITFKANQVYTSTLAQFSVSSPGTITILPNDASNPSNGSSPVLSAGGSLTLDAADIYQDGVLKAPMGTLDLNGTDKVVLNPGSLTSVSSEGQTVPFGYIQGGNAWYYADGYLVQITAPPQKIVKLEGPDVTVSKAATVDLSGGGDLFATEFFAGIGGTTNVLDPTQAAANTYAIVPGISGYSPYDPQSAGQYAQSASKTVLNNDGMIYLSGGNGIKVGYYSLLPASYALLPGAYRVTAVSGYQDMQPGLGALTLPDGSQIIAGKFEVAGTSIMDARWS
ncbi:MAG TPA: hypothetical protein PLK99_07480, partial [Burkholderiales bacterium]|nr:hypothetical protein [Burkholderiales bacterium]